MTEAIGWPGAAMAAACFLAGAVAAWAWAWASVQIEREETRRQIDRNYDYRKISGCEDPELQER